MASGKSTIGAGPTFRSNAFEPNENSSDQSVQALKEKIMLELDRLESSALENILNLLVLMER